MARPDCARSLSCGVDSATANATGTNGSAHADGSPAASTSADSTSAASASPAASAVIGTASASSAESPASRSPLASVASRIFRADDLAVISAPIDFVGLNIYSGRYFGESQRPLGSAHTDIGWNVAPESLAWGAAFFHERYGLPVYITENGMASHDWVSLDGAVHDSARIDFLHRYLLQLREAADAGADIRGYFQWSLLDNFEWAEGYTQRFGMVYCDYATQKRIPKDSARWYKQVIEANGKNL